MRMSRAIATSALILIPVAVGAQATAAAKDQPATTGWTGSFEAGARATDVDGDPSRIERYRDCGVDGLTDRSRRPYRHANQLPIQIETLIVRLKEEKPAWGAEAKRIDREYFNRSMSAGIVLQDLPQATNRVDLDPTVRDAWGVPVARVTHSAHPNDLAMANWLVDRCGEILEAAGGACGPKAPMVEQGEGHRRAPVPRRRPGRGERGYEDGHVVGTGLQRPPAEEAGDPAAGAVHDTTAW